MELDTYDKKEEREMERPSLEFIDLRIEDRVAFAFLNRPEKLNALNEKLWFEIRELADWVSESKEVRALILSGHGGSFTAGIDLNFVMEMQKRYFTEPEGVRQESLRTYIGKLQASFNALRNCEKPTIAAIHGHCIGGGVDLITAFDLRYGTKGSTFSVKEVDLGIVADIGTLQRLPLFIGEAKTRELAFTARNFDGTEAHRLGLLNDCFETPEEMSEACKKMAKQIASKSPLTIRGIKKVLNYNEDRNLEDGLDYVANWNAASLFSDDLKEAFNAYMEKRMPEFKD